MASTPVITTQNNLVTNWFGDQFIELHPLLQRLHVNGGQLKGKVTISYGRGVAGIIGRRFAKRMQLPKTGTHQLLVSISHDDEYLHWNRRFDDQQSVESLFKPVGQIGNGYWLETTGLLSMKLTVDIKDGGWYWRCLNVNFLDFPLPLWLTPRSNAYKIIENGMYRFHVSFSLPVLGSLVSYQGLLEAEGFT